jgi:hypothetical protein
LNKKIVAAIIAVAVVVSVIIAIQLDPYYYVYATKDNNIQQGFTYWGQSSWGKGGTSWTWDGSTKVTMSVSSGSGAWNGIGLFQGSKPFGWGDAPNKFTPHTMDTVAWTGKVVTVGGLQANLGVDLWFNVNYGSTSKIAEIYVLFYSAGWSALNTGAKSLVQQSSGGNTWAFETYHYAQMGIGTAQTYQVSISNEVNWCKQALTSDPVYKNGVWNVRAIDSHFEVYSGSVKYELDYCALWYYVSIGPII